MCRPLVNPSTTRGLVLLGLLVWLACNGSPEPAAGARASVPDEAPAPASTRAPAAPPTPAPVPIAAPGLAPVTAGASENACVECHRRAETARKFPAWAQDQFIHWYGAAHGRAGVTCDRCHGGDPAGAGQVASHVGVLPSNEPQSPTYYKNVPQTCGTCHGAVYEAFAKSRHYKELIADRLAPSCNTCHGFQMEVGAVTPNQLVSRCVLCHNGERGVQPQVVNLAHSALDAIGETRAAIQKAKVTLELVREQGGDASEPAALLAAAERELAATGAHWHSFRLEVFAQELTGIQAKAETARVLAMQTLLAD